MDVTGNRGSTFLMRIVLALIVAWAAGCFCVSVSLLWVPRGTVGISADYSGNVTNVVTGSPAATKAGIQKGDTILLPGTPFESRPKLIGATTPVAPGTQVPLQFRQGDTTRTVTLTAKRLELSSLERFSYVIELTSTAIFAIVGAGLILLRPRVVTWGFGLFCLFTNPVVAALSRFPSAAAHLAYVSFYDVAQNVGLIGLLVFALNFPNRVHKPWRRVVVRALWPIFITMSLWTLAIDYGVCVFAIPMHGPNVALQVAFGVILSLCVALLTETYLTGPVESRSRLRWVLVGFYIGLACNYIGSVLIYTANVSLPLWLDNALVATAVTLPLTVSYAVVRHRVIEIDFFLSRALVYAIFTTVLVVLFALSDWLFSHVLADFRLSLVLDGLISIGAAFAFDGAKSFLERTVDRVIFRGRRIAHDRLARASQALRFVKSASTVDDMLVREAHEALDIATLGLFREDGNIYRRVASCGWDGADVDVLPQDDRLITEHLSIDGALHLSDIPWTRPDLPGGLDRPVLSIPLRSGSTLAAILLCSLKPHGEHLDPEELDWLCQFARSAGAAYDELNTAELRHVADELRLQVTILDARLQEAHRDGEIETELGKV